MFIPTSWLSCSSEGQEAGFNGLGRGGACSSLHCGFFPQAKDQRLGGSGCVACSALHCGSPSEAQGALFNGGCGYGIVPFFICLIF